MENQPVNKPAPRSIPRRKPALAVIAALVLLGLTVIFGVCLAGAYLAGRSTATNPPPLFDPPKLGTVDYDVTYCILDGVTLKME